MFRSIRYNKLIIGIIIVALVFSIGYAVFGFVKNKKSTENVGAASGSKAITTQGEWEAGSTTNVDSTTVPGSIMISDKTTGNVELDLLPGTVTASPDANKRALIDDLLAPEWQCDPVQTCWWVIDMGAPIYVGKISIEQLRSSESDFDMSIYTSDDGVDWDLVTTYTVPTTGEGLSYLFEYDSGPLPLNKRYWRLAGMAYNPDIWPVAFNYLKLYSPKPFATHTSASTQLDAGDHPNMDWTTFAPSATIPANTSVNFRFRTSTDGATWGSWTGSTAYAASIDIASLLGAGDAAKRYLQTETTLANTDGASTPTLDSYTANYNYHDLDHVTVSPATATLAPSGTQAFTAIAYDDASAPIAGATFSWSADCGSIDGTGNYTAPASPGTCTVTAQSTVSGVTKSGTATVTITAAPTPTPTPVPSVIPSGTAIPTPTPSTTPTSTPSPTSSATSTTIPDDCYVNGVNTCDGDGCLTGVTISSPVKSAKYLLGQTLPVKWSVKDSCIGALLSEFPNGIKYKIDLSTNNGEAWQTIAQDIEDSALSSSTAMDNFKSSAGTPENQDFIKTNSFNYLIPNRDSFITENARVRIMPYDGNASSSSARLAGNNGLDTQNPTEPFTIDSVSERLTISLSPTVPLVKPNQTGQLTASAKNEFGHDVTSSTTFSFKLTRGGTISSIANKATITAGSDQNYFINSIKVTATKGSITTSLYTSLIVSDQEIMLDKIAIKPPAPTIELSSSATLTALPLDQFGREMTDVNVTWDLLDQSVGTLTPDSSNSHLATLTGTKSGCYSYIIKATATYKDKTLFDVSSVRVMVEGEKLTAMNTYTPLALFSGRRVGLRNLW